MKNFRFSVFVKAFSNSGSLVVGIFLVAMFLPSSAWATTGQVCIGPIPKSNNEERGLGNPAGGGNIFDFSVQIDEGKVKDIPHETNVLYGGLDLEKKHWVRIRNQGKQVESFPFSFKKYEVDSLCLWFKSLYGTWSLWPQRDSYHLCDCRN